MEWSRLSLALLVASSLVVTGCTTYDSPFVHKSEAELDAMEARDETAARLFALGQYDRSMQIAEELSAEPTVSRPLYQLEQVSNLIMQNRDDEAHALMMSVRGDMEMLFDRESEEKAVSLWHGENNKVFKGDNHERAILYAFLAMSFIERGEWEDALRSVKNGLLADSSNDPNNSYSSDFHLLQYLGYIAAKRAGDDDLAGEYRRELGDMRLGDDAAEANAFLVIWSGTPPSFARGGAYDEVRQIIPGNDMLSMVTVEGTDGEITAPHNLADVNFQARTRGGREMDTVVANKAAIKSGMEASGNILIIAGMACLSSIRNNSSSDATLVLGCVGGVCCTLGLTFHIVGACINSSADVRYWKNLPGSITVVPLRLPPGKTTLTVRGYRGWDNVLRERCEVSPSDTGIAFHHVALSKVRILVKSALQKYMEAENESSARQTPKMFNWKCYEVTE